jgi:hypothetical protein
MRLFCDEIERIDKEMRLVLLFDFKEWNNEEIGKNCYERRVTTTDIKIYLLRDCTSCYLSMKYCMEEWKQCRICAADIIDKHDEHELLIK